MDRTAIHQLLEKKRFDAESVAPLEQFVATGAYDFEADHALLKLYQLHPSTSNKAVIAKVLARALGQLPACDFVQHLYLIPESVQSEEVIANCVAAHDLMERAMFAEFWTKATGPLFDAADLKKNLRNFIHDTISKTYTVISVAHYGELMNLKGDELQAHLKELESSGYKQVDSTLHIPSDASALKPKQAAESLQFEQLGKVLAPLR